jgi:hypothetical protein
VRVDPINPTLKAPEHNLRNYSVTYCFQLLLSEFNLCRYILAAAFARWLALISESAFEEERR